MQKYALKRYKIKQMFIFTLTKIAICYKILISVIFERIVVTMGLTLTEKILKAHLVDGEFVEEKKNISLFMMKVLKVMSRHDNSFPS